MANTAHLFKVALLIHPKSLSCILNSFIGLLDFGWIPIPFILFGLVHVMCALKPIDLLRRFAPTAATIDIQLRVIQQSEW